MWHDLLDEFWRRKIKGAWVDFILCSVAEGTKEKGKNFDKCLKKITKLLFSMSKCRFCPGLLSSVAM